jgi:hypothetical protein
MSRKQLFAFASLVIVLAVVISAYALAKKSTHQSSVTSSATSSPQQSSANSHGITPPTGKPVTTSGTIGCLTPKDTTGPQVQSCAIGLRTSDGTSYALSSQDPTLVGSLPTGQKVQVAGTLSVQSSQYDIAGVIDVTSLQQQ